MNLFELSLVVAGVGGLLVGASVGMSALGAATGLIVAVVVYGATIGPAVLVVKHYSARGDARIPLWAQWALLASAVAAPFGAVRAAAYVSRALLGAGM